MQLSFSWNALIPLSLSHKLAPQVYSSFHISKILSYSPSLHDSSSAPWLHMVFTTHHDVYFSNYVSDYFRTDILHLHICVVCTVYRRLISKCDLPIKIFIKFEKITFFVLFLDDWFHISHYQWSQYKIHDKTKRHKIRDIEEEEKWVSKHKILCPFRSLFVIFKNQFLAFSVKN